MRRLLAASAAFFVLGIMVAAAQTTTGTMPAPTNTVSIPVGDWINSIIAPLQSILGALLTAGALAIVAMLPSWMQTIVRPLVLTWQANKLFDNAAAAAVAGVQGATAGRTVDINVANSLVRSVLQMVLTTGAPEVIAFVGNTATQLAQTALAHLQKQEVTLPADYTTSEAVQQAQAVISANPMATAKV